MLTLDDLIHFFGKPFLVNLIIGLVNQERVDDDFSFNCTCDEIANVMCGLMLQFLFYFDS